MPRHDELIHLDEQDPRRAKKALKHRLLQSGDGRCLFCGVLGAGTIDHLIPLNKGGTDDPINWARACYSCNHAKGHQDAVIWLRRQRFHTPSRESALRDRLAMAREWVV